MFFTIKMTNALFRIKKEIIGSTKKAYRAARINETAL